MKLDKYNLMKNLKFIKRTRAGQIHIFYDENNKTTLRPAHVIIFHITLNIKCIFNYLCGI